MWLHIPFNSGKNHTRNGSYGDGVEKKKGFTKRPPIQSKGWINMSGVTEKRIARKKRQHLFERKHTTTNNNQADWGVASPLRVPHTTDAARLSSAEGVQDFSAGQL